MSSFSNNSLAPLTVLVLLQLLVIAQWRRPCAHTAFSSRPTSRTLRKVRVVLKKF